MTGLVAYFGFNHYRRDEHIVLGLEEVPEGLDIHRQGGFQAGRCFFPIVEIGQTGMILFRHVTFLTGLGPPRRDIPVEIAAV